MTPPNIRHAGRLEIVGGSFLILLAVVLLYGHTLNAPFYMDDDGALVQNYLLRDLPEVVKRLFSQRGLTNLTFAVNYRLTGWSLAPLHLTNIALHAGCGLLVWTLLRRLLGGRLLPLLGALLFVAHPLQTQAVIYLVQRAAVLAAFFFLLAVFCHLRARDALVAGHARNSAVYLRPYLGAVAAGVCAVLAKEGTIVLPLLLVVHDLLFPLPGARDWRQTTLDLSPYLLACGGACTAILLTLPTAEEAMGHYPLASLLQNDPLHYLFTQFSVLWIYLRLLFLPYGQALEHDFPIVGELLTVQNCVALAGLLMLGWLGWRMRRQRPLLAFGMAWFFLALAVESSVIPLDPLFEHRLYLPMLGFVLVLLDGLPALLGERRGVTLLVVALVVCAPLTWRRNTLWNDPIAFYQDNLRVVPDSERALMDLAFRFELAGRYEDMRQVLERAVARYPRNHGFYTSLAELYTNLDGLEPALALLDEGIRRMPENVELYEMAALVAEIHERPTLIFDYLQRGLAATKSGKWRLLNDLGIYRAGQGDWRQAEQAYRDSLALCAANPVAYQYLGALYFTRQRWPEALAALQEANRLEPGNPETLEGLGRSALQVGDRPLAMQAAETLRHIDAQRWQKLQSMLATTAKVE